MESRFTVRRRPFVRSIFAAMIGSVGGCDLAAVAGDRFQIRGLSMAPTLMDRSIMWRCRRCEFAERMDANQIEMAHDAGRPIVCIRCGVRAERVNLARSLRRPADVVEVRHVTLDSLVRGDCVAIAHNGRRHIKRLVGLPGDRVAWRANAILINGREPDHQSRPSIPAATITLDHVTAQFISNRWHSIAQYAVYRPTNVHRPTSAKSTFLDDYPTNLMMDRELHSIRNLIVEVRVPDARDGVEVGISISGIHRSGVVTEPTRKLRFDQLRPSRVPTALRDAGPNFVAIRCDLDKMVGQGGAVRIERPIEYRARRQDNRPPDIDRLRENEVFVLGDNVPVSVDSRRWGPIAANQILGRVSRLA